MPVEEQDQCSDPVLPARLQLALRNIPTCLCVSKEYNFEVPACWIWLCVSKEVLSGSILFPQAGHNLCFQLPALVLGQEQEVTGDGHRHS